MFDEGPQLCVVCGGKLPKASMVKRVGGWPVCAHHRVFVKEAKFDSKCHECLGDILEGEEVILAIVVEGFKEEKPQWAVFHPRHKCRKIDEGNVSRATSGPWATLYLVPGAPVEVIKASYKALAFKYHPDRPTGSEAKMKELNMAVGELIK